MSQQAVLVCEGFDDRAFLAQWLETLGCKDARHNGVAYDPWGKPVGGGQFAYIGAGGAFIRLVPSHGRTRIARTVDLYVQGQPARPLSHLVAVYDSDSIAPAWDLAAGDIDGSLARASDAGITASRVVWGCSDPAETIGVPRQQTIERLISASISAAFPARATAVATWLTTAPDTQGHDAKAHGYSYMAKWYADHGCDDFHRQAWRDPAVRPQLEQRLRACGGSQTMEAVVNATP